MLINDGIETVVLPHLPAHQIQLGLFQNVQNVNILRQQLLDGNTDFEYAFLDASVLLSRKHILSACFRAIMDMQCDRMKSRNVHSEIVFSLSPNNNIAESFRRFGIQNSTEHIVAIKVLPSSASVDAVIAHLVQNVQGEVVPCTEAKLGAARDEARIWKVYRTDGKVGSANYVPAEEVEAFVVGSMALKGS